MSKLQRVEGLIWCLSLGEVHNEDTINPYGMGPEEWCTREDHRPIYWRPRVGDDEHE